MATKRKTTKAKYLSPKEREAMVEKIAGELAARNEAIGAEGRSRKDLLSDANFVCMVEHDGITLETLAMMLTDAFNAARHRA
jgi:hypothetical protein